MKEYKEEAVEHVLTSQNEIGESPIWVAEEERLYWTDTERSSVTSYRPGDHTVRRSVLSLPVTALVRRRGGGWLAVTKKGLAYWDPFTNLCEVIADPTADRDDLAFNDGTADPAGRVIAGTMNFRELTAPDGAIYRLDPDLSVTRLDADLRVANGIAFSPDGRIMYVSEQWNSRILAYDYDAVKGELSGRRTFSEVPPEEGYPDGLVVDAEGCIWNGRWGGARIVRYTPAGGIDRIYRLPVEVGTCIGFGGRKLRDLYITSAWYGMSGSERRRSPAAGDLFRIRTDVSGITERRFAG